MNTAHVILASMSVFLTLMFGFLLCCIGRDLKAFDRAEDAAVDDWRRSL